MTHKHTPGPWKMIDAHYPGIDGDIAGNRVSIIVFGDEYEDCGIQGNTLEEAKANARLITAAPELLGELKGLLLVIPPSVKTEIQGHIDAAEAVIAKATGEA